MLRVLLGDVTGLGPLTQQGANHHHHHHHHPRHLPRPLSALPRTRALTCAHVHEGDFFQHTLDNIKLVSLRLLYSTCLVVRLMLHVLHPACDTFL